MKTLPIPVPTITRTRNAYNALMADDLPIDFDKIGELIQAAGEIVRHVEIQSTRSFKPKFKRVR